MIYNFIGFSAFERYSGDDDLYNNLMKLVEHFLLAVI